MHPPLPHTPLFKNPILFMRFHFTTTLFLKTTIPYHTTPHHTTASPSIIVLVDIYHIVTPTYPTTLFSFSFYCNSKNSTSFMKTTNKMQGLLCQSHASTAVCRSHVSTAVCMSTDPRAVIAPQGQYDIKYARMGDHARRFGSAGGDHYRAVTLQMVTNRERTQPKPKPKPRHTNAMTNTSTAARAVVPSVTSSNDHLFQVVVMRVSLHCQGCAGKVRKLISKMEGVSSFSIDLETKRVTVMGHVSPVGVLESISKVKKAEFWTC